MSNVVDIIKIGYLGGTNAFSDAPGMRGRLWGGYPISSTELPILKHNVDVKVSRFRFLIIPYIRERVVLVSLSIKIRGHQ